MINGKRWIEFLGHHLQVKGDQNWVAVDYNGVVSTYVTEPDCFGGFWLPTSSNIGGLYVGEINTSLVALAKIVKAEDLTG